MNNLFKKRILKRYFRATRAHPKGSVVHHGDCDFYSIQICTCGLLHDLRAELEKARKLYPQVDAEIIEHDRARDRIMEED